MKSLRILSAACMIAFATPAFSQDVPDTLAAVLEAQGFTVTSTRYTWLGRIFVEATNGEIDRGILIARGSGQILQDNWIVQVQTTSTSASDDNDDDDTSGSTTTTSNDDTTSDANDKPPPRAPRPPSGGKPPPGGRP